jgi:Leucine-rich repeat (LRR) protein
MHLLISFASLVIAQTSSEEIKLEKLNEEETRRFFREREFRRNPIFRTSERVKLDFSLENLDLSSCGLNDDDLEEISIYLGRMNNLKELDLSNNQITIVSKFIFPLRSSKLEIIKLGNNNIWKIPADTFTASKELVYLDLSGNMIQRVPRNLLDSNTKLEEVDLGVNYIQDIPLDLFSTSKSLISLNLSYNRFTYVNHWNLNTPNLINLDLSNNQISDIDISFFRNILDLKVIYLERNILTTDFKTTTVEALKNKFQTIHIEL